MRIQIFQVDAFTGRLFGGNPAAVCPLEEWLDDGLLQNIAMENNLSETAFFVPQGDGFRLRWFTPATEVSLCGHATLAAAHVLWNHLGSSAQELRFDTRSGPVSVLRQDGRMALDFPALPAAPFEAPSALLDGLGLPPREVLRARESPDSFNFLAVYASEEDVRSLRPDYRQLATLQHHGVIVSSRGSDESKIDFVSRYFCPAFGIDEDPVTGSIHCSLTPYWAEQLGKTRLEARQVSPRGGELSCQLRGNRVRIAGQAVTFLEGVIRT